MLYQLTAPRLWRRGLLALMTASLALSGCSKGSSAVGGSLVGANITGAISATGNGHSSSFHSLKNMLHIKNSSGAVCTATAYALNGSTALATGTANGSGEFTITGGSITSGQSYKVVVSCSGGGGFTAILGADSTQPGDKTPAPVDPVTTLIAVQIVQA